MLVHLDINIGQVPGSRS